MNAEDQLLLIKSLIGGGTKCKITDRAEPPETSMITTRALARELKYDCNIAVSHKTVLRAMLKKQIFIQVSSQKATAFQEKHKKTINHCK